MLLGALTRPLPSPMIPERPSWRANGIGPGAGGVADDAAKVGGQRRLEGELALGHRMPKREAMGVQREARRLGAAESSIADDRMTEGCGVKPDLVLAAGLEHDLDEGVGARAAHRREMAAGRFGVGRRRPADGGAAEPPRRDRAIGDDRLDEPARQQRGIGPVDAMGLELVLQRRIDLAAFRQQQKSRGLPIEAVQERGIRPIAPRDGEQIGFDPPRGMHRHAKGFIDHQDPVIFINDGELHAQKSSLPGSSIHTPIGSTGEAGDLRVPCASGFDKVHAVNLQKGSPMSKLSHGLIALVLVGGFALVTSGCGQRSAQCL